MFILRRTLWAKNLNANGKGEISWKFDKFEMTDARAWTINETIRNEIKMYVINRKEILAHFT